MVDSGIALILSNGLVVKIQRPSILLLFMMVSFTGCALHQTSLTRDSEKLKETKRVAVLPFFNTTRLSAEFQKKKWMTNYFAWTEKFMSISKSRMKDRFDFLPTEEVVSALTELGNYGQASELKPKHYRTGYSLGDALKVGKSLCADAVLLGATTQAQTQSAKQVYTSAMTLRLVDVASGKVIWGGSLSGKKGRSSIISGMVDVMKVAQ